MATFLGLLLFSVPALLIAAGIAVVVNLPISQGERFLILLCGLWAILMLQALYRIAGHVDEAQRWSRLTFIAIHLRNEQDGLTSAMQRLRDDLWEERTIRGIAGSEDMINIFLALSAVVCAIGLGLILHFGWFGPVAARWLNSVLG